MKTIEKAGPIRARVAVPASKSITNRALLLAAMAEGNTTVVNPLASDDSHYMLEAIRTSGFVIEGSLRRGEVTIGPRVTMSAGEVEIFIGNAGTAMRFLTGYLPFLPGRFVLTGEERMLQRPIGDLVESLQQIGAEVEYAGREGYPPISVRGRKMRGGIHVTVSGRTSSQFVSALMMGGATLPNGLDLTVIDAVSRPYVGITKEVLAAFGARVADAGPDRYHIEGGELRCERFEVEGDYSSASYWFAAAAATGGTVEVSGVRPDSAQGDRAFLDLLNEMGCRIEWLDDSVRVTGPEKLIGGQFDMNAIPDTVPTLAAIAPSASSPIEISNVANLRVKESDRISVLATELRRLGARVEERPDGVTIQPGWSEEEVVIDPHGDHRIAMSFAIAGLARGYISIDDEKVVSKSYPGFWNDLESLMASR